MTAPTPLRPPGPALTLNMAADRLRRAAQLALDAEAEDGRAPERWCDGMDNMLGGPVGEFCGLISPGAGLDLADWLDEIAAEAVRQARMGGTEEAVTDEYPIRMAQRVLGEEAL